MISPSLFLTENESHNMTAAYSKFKSPWKVRLRLSRQTVSALKGRTHRDFVPHHFMSILPHCCSLYSTEVKSYGPEANMTSNQASKWSYLALFAEAQPTSTEKQRSNTL